MIFQHTIDKVLSREKTQTRRLVKPGECLRSIEHFLGGYKPLAVMHNNYPKWQIGRSYAVQPGRGKSAVYWKRTARGEIVVRQGIEWRPNDGPDGTDWDDMHRVDLRKDWIASGYREARIRITNIWREDVRMMSESDLEAEGFCGKTLPPQREFLAVWCAMHDPSFLKKFPVSRWGWYGLDDSIYERPYNRYTAWAIEFELA